jgi:hypothetical protein
MMSLQTLVVDRQTAAIGPAVKGTNDAASPLSTKRQRDPSKDMAGTSPARSRHAHLSSQRTK